MALTTLYAADVRDSWGPKHPGKRGATHHFV